MANLSQMKFHEMKVEREPFENLTDKKKIFIQPQSPLQATPSGADAKSSILPQPNDVLRNARNTLVSNFELDKIEKKVTEIMQTGGEATVPQWAYEYITGCTKQCIRKCFSRRFT